jgi:hypothetical protein
VIPCPAQRDVLLEFPSFMPNQFAASFELQGLSRFTRDQFTGTNTLSRAVTPAQIG